MPSQRASAQRRTTSSQIDHVYDPGKVGRKTGVTLQERDRDEQGFEDMDIFSSPEKDIHGNAIYPPSEDEQDMEIDDESQMGPATMMKQRQERERLSLPRARSPIKTSLKSPARQNPHMPPTSSPTRGSIVTSREHSPPRMVSRRLDFSKSAQTQMKPVTNGQRKLNGTKPRNGKITNGRSHTEDEDSDDESIPNRKPGRQSEEQEDDEEDEDEVDQMQALDHDSGDGDLPEQEPEPEPEPEEEDDESVVQQSKPTPKPKAGKPKTGKPKGRPKKATPPPQEESEASVESVPTPVEEVEEAEEEPVKKKRGRPKAGQSPTEAEPSAKASKRRKQQDNSIEETEEQENIAEARETKRPRTEKKENKSKVSKPTAAKEKGKPGRKRKSSGIGVDSPVVQRGPPLPKSRGLVTLRREEQDSMRTTRSGRASYRPLEFWKGERVEYDTAKAEVFEDKGRHFAMPTIKGIVRAEEVESEKAPRRRRGRPAARGGPRRSASIIEEEVEREDWELDGGHIVGDCVLWRPEYQFDPPEDGGVEIQETELAISDAAIEARPVKDSTFLFAKTLTMPFFGSGIVEMPPGSEKRHKNTRKMHMVFFVHTGSVTVNIADNEFQIGKGGTWFVPRGNFYGIRNETNKTSRIFFAQGCETLVQAEVLEQE
ncbi:Mif2/CENP-C like-domain-containing protein [Whalleya microplaca]|nr:Mif2/CENP-C like-domain-containing protein [Whalleya microplaca]